MSTIPRDGGPAFPYGESQNLGVETFDPSVGISVRDYFAIRTLQSLLMTVDARVLNGDLGGNASSERPSYYACVAYVMADAMLAERSKP